MVQFPTLDPELIITENFFITRKTTKTKQNKILFFIFVLGVAAVFGSVPQEDIPPAGLTPSVSSTIDYSTSVVRFTISPSTTSYTPATSSISTNRTQNVTSPSTTPGIIDPISTDANRLSTMLIIVIAVGGGVMLVITAVAGGCFWWKRRYTIFLIIIICRVISMMPFSYNLSFGEDNTMTITGIHDNGGTLSPRPMVSLCNELRKPTKEKHSAALQDTFVGTDPVSSSPISVGLQSVNN